MTIRGLMAVCALATASAAYGGSKGFTVVMLDIGGQRFFDSSVYKANAEGEFSETKEWSDCWDRRATGGKSFDLVIKKVIPEGLTLDMASAIWNGDGELTKRAQRIIAKTKTPRGQSIDGLYVINAKDGRISVMALGSRAPIGKRNPSPKISIPWDEGHPQQGALAFDIALCKISHPLDVGFSP